MARYIDAEKLIREYLDLSEHEFPTASGNLDEFLNNDIPNLIRNFNTEDVQPVVHAHWILRIPFAQCSECKRFCGQWDYDNSDNYCRHCGAKMDEEPETDKK